MLGLFPKSTIVRSFSTVQKMQVRNISYQPLKYARNQKVMMYDESEYDARIAYLHSVGDPTGEYHPDILGMTQENEDTSETVRDSISQSSDDESDMAHRHAMCQFRS